MTSKVLLTSVTHIDELRTGTKNLEASLVTMPFIHFYLFNDFAHHKIIPQLVPSSSEANSCISYVSMFWPCFRVIANDINLLVVIMLNYAVKTYYTCVWSLILLKVLLLPYFSVHSVVRSTQWNRQLYFPLHIYCGHLLLLTARDS